MSGAGAKVLASQQGGVMLLRLNRPEKKNALDRQMYRALSDGLEAAQGDPQVAAVVLTGVEGAFTAGNDIADFLAAAAEAPGGAGPAAAEVVRFVRLLPRLEKPLLAAVDGLAIGIGTTLLFHCDYVLASDQAVFQTPFVDLGLVPEAGSSLLAPRLMGHRRAFELLVMGVAFPAERMREAGLVNGVLPAATLEGAVMSAAHSLAAKPQEAVRASHRLLAGTREELIARIEEELCLFESQLKLPVAIAAFRDFLEKKRRGGSPPQSG